MDKQKNNLINSFMVAPDDSMPAMPGSPSVNDDREVITSYKIPVVAWMIIFLVGGYLGLRWILED